MVRLVAGKSGTYLGKVRLLAVQFWQDTGGSNALEFGLCAIPFFGLIFCFSESIYINYFTDALQLAVAQAARAVETGQAQGDGGTSQGVAYNAPAFARNFICSSNGIGTFNGVSGGSKVGSDNGFPAYLSQNNCANVFVDIRPAQKQTFSSAGSTAQSVFYNQPPVYELGCPNTIVLIRVAYPLPAIFPVSIFAPAASTVTDFPNTNGSHVHVITAIQVVQTEPYQNNGQNGGVVYSDPPNC